MIRILVVLATLLVGALPAAAASFDCARAATPVENQICADPELSRSDEVLAQAYATALGGLSDAARAVVQKAQRAWIDYAPLSCSDDARPFTAALTEDQTACFRSAYVARIRDLEESRMRGGWRFYMQERFAVVDDPEPEWWGTVAKKEYSSPRIDDDSPTALAFNAFVEALDAELADPGGSPEDDATTDVTQTVRVDAVTPHRIGLAVDTWWYGHGAAHGNYDIVYRHFLTDENRPLIASDLFEGEGWEAALGELALAELDRTIEGGIWQESRADVPAAAADPARWNFTDAGLVLQFQPYEVTAYAYGAPTVTIPWTALRAWMVTDADYRLLY